MMIKNKSLEVSVFHSATFKEPIGFFLFIKGGNVPREINEFLHQFLSTDKISLKKLNTWSFIPSLEQVYSRLAEMILSSFPVCPGETTEQAQFNPEWIQIFSQVSKLRFLRIIRKCHFGKRYFLKNLAFHVKNPVRKDFS